MIFSLAIISVGLGMLSDSGEAPKFWPQRHRPEPSLFVELMFAFEKFPEPKVKSRAIEMLREASEPYGDWAMLNDIEWEEEEEVPTWALMPPQRLVDVDVEPYVFWMVREIDRIHQDSDTDFEEATAKLQAAMLEIIEWAEEEDDSLEETTWSEAIARTENQEKDADPI